MNRSLRLIISTLLAALALAACSVAPEPQAELITPQAASIILVNTFADDPADCATLIASDFTVVSLREAICRANVASGTVQDQLSVQLEAGTYAVDSVDTGGISIHAAVQVVVLGAVGGGTIIDAGSTDRIFDIQAGTTVIISGVTVQGGSFSSGSGAGLSSSGTLTVRDSVFLNNKGSQAGGAIYSDGNLTVERTTFTGNHSNNGGAIYQAGSGTGIVRQSTMNGNQSTSHDGGALFVTGTSTMTIESSTMSGNHSAEYGGSVVTGSLSSAVVSINNSTIVHNTSGLGAAVTVFGGSITLTSSIMANLGGNCSGVTNGGFNLEFGTTCGFGVSADPLLGPLQDNGGPTWTHAIAEGSPALDAGSSGGILEDQRGLARTFDFSTTATATGGDETDIGAFELQAITCESIASGDWDVASTWSCGAVPTEHHNVVVKMNHKVDLKRSEKVRNLKIEQGGTLDKGKADTDAHVLTVKRNLTLDGELRPRRGTIEFSGLEKQAISGTSTSKRFHNLRVSKSETTTEKELEILETITVEKDLHLVRGQLRANSTELENLVIEQEAKLVSRASAIHRVRGNWTQHGLVETGTSTVEFVGTKRQIVRGNADYIEFNRLKVNKSETLTTDQKTLETTRRVNVRETLEVVSGQFEPVTRSRFRNVLIRNSSRMRPVRQTGELDEIEVSGNLTKEASATYDKNLSRVRFTGGVNALQEVRLYSPTNMDIDPSTARVRLTKQYSDNTESEVYVRNSLSTRSPRVRLVRSNVVTLSRGSVVLEVTTGPVVTTVDNVTITVPAGSIVTIREPIHGRVSVEHTSSDDTDTVTVQVGDDTPVELGVNETADNNEAPTAIANATDPLVAYAVDEGSSISLTGKGVDTDGWIDAYEWDLNYDPIAGTFSLDATGATPTFDASSLDGPATHTVALRVRDNENAESDLATAIVTINNAPPVITGVANAGSIHEGGSVTIDVSATDPGSDPLTYAYDCDNDHTYETASNNCSFADDGSFTVNVRVTDDANASATSSTLVAVTNVAPTIDLTGSASVDEGSAFALTLGTITDPGDDTVTNITVNWGDGTTDTYATTGEVTHTYADGPENHTITADLTDEDGTHTNAGTHSVTVDNVPPTITDVTTNAADPKNPVIAVNTEIGITVSFQDPGADQLTCSFDYNNGTVDPNVATTVSDCTTTTSYSEAGVYTVAITVADDDGGVSATSLFEYVVVYDPDAGFVTGGGWIDSPAGAYYPDPSAVGKATFGFVSRYKKGADTPSGNTEFQFKAANVDFHSDTYEWLVVAGARAQYKGVGTLNGQPGFGFFLVGVDGQASGGGGVDKFRIKIWDETDDDIVYDNQPGQDSDSKDSTELGGGSIVIHSK